MNYSIWPRRYRKLSAYCELGPARTQHTTFSSMPVSHEERQALIDSLVPWLESERAALVANLSEQGISLTRPVRRIFAERQFVFKQEGEDKKGFWSLDKTVEDEVEVSRFWRRDKWLPMRWRGSNRSPIAP